jgi:hypothetical protein
VLVGRKRQERKSAYTLRQLRVCWCGTLSLTRERVCRLQLLLVLASKVIFGSESRGTCDHISLSPIRDFPFRRLLRLAGLWWRYSTPPLHGIMNSIKSKWSRSHIATDGQSISKSWCRAPSARRDWQWSQKFLLTKQAFYYPPNQMNNETWLLSQLWDSYGLVFVGCPLWREGGSVFYICC